MVARIELREHVVIFVFAAICCVAGGCATSGNKAKVDDGLATAQPSASSQMSPPRVDAIEMTADRSQGQTTWRIKPEVSVVPASHGQPNSPPPYIANRMRYAFDLAQRGATYSAYAEFQNVLELCAVELDAATGESGRQLAVQHGFIALEEAEEFATSTLANATGAVDVSRIADSHQTPLKRQVADESWTADQAKRAYYEFAVTRIVDGLRGSPAAGNALYGMGRTASLLNSGAAQGALRAMLLYDMALRVEPNHQLAANELGVLLAQNGRLVEAESVLNEAVARGGTAEIWRNLSAVYDRQGRSNESLIAQKRANELLHSHPSNTEVLASTVQVNTVAGSIQPGSGSAKPEVNVAQEPVVERGQSVATRSLEQNKSNVFGR